MNIFDYLFGNKTNEVDKESQPLSDESRKVLEYTDPVEQYVLLT